MWIIYKIIISSYFSLIKVASWFRTDAKKWVDGRKNFDAWIASQNPENHRHIWIHCSSLGEFEQGRALIDTLKFSYPHQRIWLSFFSPSGYEVRKKYPQADVVSYFPSDNLNDVKKFIERINPSLVIFIKYDFWYHTLSELSSRSIPFAFVSVRLHQNSYLRKFWASGFLDILRKACLISVQDQDSFEFLKLKHFDNVLLAGDGRIDRIINLGKEVFQNEYIDLFCGKSPILVVGSSWKQELVILKKALRSPELEGWKIMIAPHNVEEKYIQECKNILADKVNLYSKGIGDFNKESKFLIIDCIGLLGNLYSKANLAFVGGGFGKGIHNILEPIAFGVPVCFGPCHKKFREAQIFIDCGFGFEIHRPEDLVNLVISSNFPNWDNERKQSIEKFLHDQKGSTEKIISYLEQNSYLR